MLLNYHTNINIILFNVCILQSFQGEGYMKNTSDILYLKIKKFEIFLDKNKPIYISCNETSCISKSNKNMYETPVRISVESLES